MSPTMTLSFVYYFTKRPVNTNNFEPEITLNFISLNQGSSLAGFGEKKSQILALLCSVSTSPTTTFTSPPQIV